MSLIVQKFGGTSVGSLERIKSITDRVLNEKQQGNKIVVVVSAMSGETNRLIEMATQINPVPFSQEYDLLISSGEQVSVGLVTLALNTEAKKRNLIRDDQIIARGFLGHQIGIRTDNVSSKARIQAIDTALLQSTLSVGVIPVIAGFQGIDSENNITTLGRGGSDTSAVAIAAALKANDCEIYTDVDGVYTTDPRLCKKAKKINQISYEEMMELASLGAKVLQIRSVELAAKYEIPLHVRSSFNSTEGTRVVSKKKLGKTLAKKLGAKMEQVLVAGIAADAAQVKFTLQNLPDEPRTTAQIFSSLSESSIVVDVIIQDIPSPGALSLCFSVGKADFLKVKQILMKLKASDYPDLIVQEENNLAKVSVVGVGMQHHPGVASKMFSILAQADIKIKLISTSEIKISCLILESNMNDAIECLHQGFGLDQTDDE